MPRTIDPGLLLIGSGMLRPEPLNLGLSSGVLTGTIPFSSGGGVQGLDAHVHDPKGAHPATSVVITDPLDVFFAKNLEDVLGEISALLPPRPAGVGFWNLILPYHSGVPDWGSLKEADASLTERDSGSFDHLSNPANEIYPYYWVQPSPANANPPFTFLGSDPATDMTFNVTHGVYTGGGPGQCFIGAFTRSNPGPVVQTIRITTRNAAAAWPVVVSGIVSPADRGVLALVYWPYGATAVGDFTGQVLADRVKAAILLGQGIDSKTGSTDCDGGPGGIFEMGETSGEYDPYAWPGQASGQPDLSELVVGPDFDAGRVRLGFDPNASSDPVIPGGLPVLGAPSTAAGGGNDNNFFRYRLPYLKDYSVSALKWTPVGQQSRFFTQPAGVSAVPGGPLLQAGDYQNFDNDYWTFQVARYRHRFEMPSTLGAGNMEDAGTMILIHFKTEKDFESYVVDGLMPETGPTPYDVYSAAQVTGTVPPDLDNVEDSGTNLAAVPYHVLRSDVVNDPTGVVEPTLISATIAHTGGAMMFVSGLEYYTPTDSAGAATFTLDDLYLEMDDFWTRTYLLSPSTSVLKTQYPVTIGLAPFAYESGNIVIGAIPDVTVSRQRINVTFEGLGQNMLLGPQIADAALIDWTGLSLTFTGDTLSPSFTAQAAARFFVRRPLGHAGVLTAIMPYASNGLVASDVSGDNILYHSTRQDGVTYPIYGNFTLVPGGPALSTLETPLKDVEERFLDEVYRYFSDWVGSGGIDPVITADLLGPGLAAFGPIAVPVRPGTTVSPLNFGDVSYIIEEYYTDDLSAVGMAAELQVAGLPSRNPRLTEGLLSPFPSAGLLRYPVLDYSAGYDPVGLDYSVCTGDRVYERAFDAAFSRNVTPGEGPVAAAGQPFVIFRIDGIKLEDFAYVAPGPGSYHESGIAIFVKVPGLTTWMDLGRADGSGPSKQDPFLDGAGCAVIGPATFDSTESTTGQVYSQVRVNVGPVANLAVGEPDEVPVLIKVLMRDPATMVDPALNTRFYDYSTESIGTPEFDPLSTSSQLSTADIRGIVGIKLVRPTP